MVNRCLMPAIGARHYDWPASILSFNLALPSLRLFDSVDGFLISLPLPSCDLPELFCLFFLSLPLSLCHFAKLSLLGFP